MDKKKETKIASLLTSAIIVVLSMFNVPWSEVGLYAGCDWHNRIIYPLFHANIVHALINAWCLLSVAFFYDISVMTMMAAYFAAIAVPIDTISSIFPSMGSITVGISGVVYVLFGFVSFQVQRKKYYQLWMAFYILVGFLIPNSNGMLHLYCYLCGLAMATLVRPYRKEVDDGCVR